MNSTSWSYVAMIGALSASACAFLQSAMGVNPFGSLLMLAAFVAIGASVAFWQTYRWRRPASGWIVYNDHGAGHNYELQGASFPAALERFLEIRDAKVCRFVQITAPNGSGFCWNNPDYLDLREMGGELGSKYADPFQDQKS